MKNKYSYLVPYRNKNSLKGNLTVNLKKPDNETNWLLFNRWPFATPWPVAGQASLSFTISHNLFTSCPLAHSSILTWRIPGTEKPGGLQSMGSQSQTRLKRLSNSSNISIESAMPSNKLTLCRPLLLLPSVVPSIKVLPNELAFYIRWPKYWSFSSSISLSEEYSGFISFRIGWFYLLAFQGTLKSSPAPQFKTISSSTLSLLCGPTLTSVHDYWKNHSQLYESYSAK